MLQYYDRAGRIISAETFIRLRDDPSYRTIAYSEVPPNYVVHTIWMGFPFDFDPHGKPYLFESCVFVDKQGIKSKSYCTESEAVVGHAQFVSETLALARFSN